MKRLKKILIVPFFGQLPSWIDLFKNDFDATMPQEYTLLFDTNLDDFKKRVKSKLGIECPIVPGTGKLWDYRCAFGILYDQEIKGFDFYGHCDLDVVFGDMDKFVPDSMLSELDVYSSHNKYVCGCFSLYRNSPEVNNLFKEYGAWQAILELSDALGWVEMEYSRTLEKSGLRYKYDFQQGFPWIKTPKLKKEGTKLFQWLTAEENTEVDPLLAKFVWKEISLFHFRHSKKWPL